MNHLLSIIICFSLLALAATQTPAPTESPDPTPTPSLTPSVQLDPSPPPTVQPVATSPPVSRCPEIPAGGCNVCGSNGCVTEPNEIFAFPGQPIVTCAQLEKAGLDGLISQFECAFLPALDEVCHCGLFSATPIPPTPAPTPGIGCPDVPSDGCNICGTKGCVQIPDAIIDLPDQPDASCSSLENDGLNGLIPFDLCPFLPGLVGDCECGFPSPTTPPAPPTPAPTDTVPFPTNGCPDVPSNGCNICGDNGCVQNPSEIFAFPGQPEVPCGTLEAAGWNGLIPLDQCPYLPALDDVCECGYPTPTTPPAPSTPAPTDTAPSPKTGCPDVPSNGCNICGDNGCVQSPFEIFAFPGQPEVPCGTLEAAGLKGLIPLDQCPYLPALDDICECGYPTDGAPHTLPPMLALPSSTPAPTPPPPTLSPTAASFPSATTPSSSSGQSDDNLELQGLDDAPRVAKALSGGAIFGILVASFVGTLVIAFAILKGRQEYIMRSTHVRGRATSTIVMDDGGGSPTKVPPPSLFEKMPDAVESNADPSDGPLDDVGII